MAEQSIVARPPRWKSFAAGIVSGVANVTAGHPLDTLKVRLQTSGRELAQRGAARPSIWAGITGPLLTVPFLAGLNFGLWDYCRVRMTLGWPQLFAREGCLQNDASQHRIGLRSAASCEEGASNGYSIFLAGVMSGWVVGNATVPMHNLKVQQQTAKADAPMTVQEAARRVGIRGLFRGYVPHMFTESVGRGFYMTGFIFSKRALNVDQKGESALLARIVCGGVGGASAWLSVYPADVVRNRMMRDSGAAKYSGVVDCCRQLYAEQGLRGFYRGVSYSLMRAIPVAAVTLPTYDLALRMLNV